MGENDEKIEIDESTAGETVEKPTVEEASEVLTPEEVKMAEEHKILATPEEKNEKKEDKPEEKKPEEKKPEEGKPETEEEKIKKYNKNETAMYFLQKKERKKRQDVEQERDRLALKVKVSEKEAADRAAAEGKTDEDKEIDDIFADEKKEGKEKESKEKTDKDKEEERTVRAERLSSNMEILTEEMTALNPDYPQAVKLAMDIYDKGDEILPNRKDQAYVKDLFKEMFHELGNVSNGKDTKRSPTEILYEIGKEHPDYKPGETPEPNGKGKKTDVLEKVKKNVAKRTSSAAVGGSTGRTFVSEDDLTAEQAVKLPGDKFRKLKPETINRLLKET